MSKVSTDCSGGLPVVISDGLTPVNRSSRIKDLMRLQETLMKRCQDCIHLPDDISDRSPGDSSSSPSDTSIEFKHASTRWRHTRPTGGRVKREGPPSSTSAGLKASMDLLAVRALAATTPLGNDSSASDSSTSSSPLVVAGQRRIQQIADNAVASISPEDTPTTTHMSSQQHASTVDDASLLPSSASASSTAKKSSTPPIEAAAASTTAKATAPTSPTTIVSTTVVSSSAELLTTTASTPTKRGQSASTHRSGTVKCLCGRQVSALSMSPDSCSHCSRCLSPSRELSGNNKQAVPASAASSLSTQRLRCKTYGSLCKDAVTSTVLQRDEMQATAHNHNKNNPPPTFMIKRRNGSPSKRSGRGSGKGKVSFKGVPTASRTAPGVGGMGGASVNKGCPVTSDRRISVERAFTRPILKMWPHSQSVPVPILDVNAVEAEADSAYFPCAPAAPFVPGTKSRVKSAHRVRRICRPGEATGGCGERGNVEDGTQTAEVTCDDKGEQTDPATTEELSTQTVTEVERSSFPHECDELVSQALEQYRQGVAIVQQKHSLDEQSAVYTEARTATNVASVQTKTKKVSEKTLQAGGFVRIYQVDAHASSVRMDPLLSGPGGAAILGSKEFPTMNMAPTDTTFVYREGAGKPARKHNPPPRAMSSDASSSFLSPQAGNPARTDPDKHRRLRTKKRPSTSDQDIHLVKVTQTAEGSLGIMTVHAKGHRRKGGTGADVLSSSEDESADGQEEKRAHDPSRRGAGDPVTGKRAANVKGKQRPALSPPVDLAVQDRLHQRRLVDEARMKLLQEGAVIDPGRVRMLKCALGNAVRPDAVPVHAKEEEGQVNAEAHWPSSEGLGSGVTAGPLPAQQILSFTTQALSKSVAQALQTVKDQEAAGVAGAKSTCLSPSSPDTGPSPPSSFSSIRVGGGEWMGGNRRGKRCGAEKWSCRENGDDEENKGGKEEKGEEEEEGEKEKVDDDEDDDEDEGDDDVVAASEDDRGLVKAMVRIQVLPVDPTVFVDGISRAEMQQWEMAEFDRQEERRRNKDRDKKLLVLRVLQPLAWRVVTRWKALIHSNRLRRADADRLLRVQTQRRHLLAWLLQLQWKKGLQAKGDEAAKIGFRQTLGKWLLLTLRRRHDRYCTKVIRENGDRNALRQAFSNWLGRLYHWHSDKVSVRHIAALTARNLCKESFRWWAYTLSKKHDLQASECRGKVLDMRTRLCVAFKTWVETRRMRVWHRAIAANVASRHERRLMSEQFHTWLSRHRHRQQIEERYLVFMANNQIMAHAAIRRWRSVLLQEQYVRRKRREQLEGAYDAWEAFLSMKKARTAQTHKARRQFVDYRRSIGVHALLENKADTQTWREKGPAAIRRHFDVCGRKAFRGWHALMCAFRRLRLIRTRRYFEYMRRVVLPANARARLARITLPSCVRFWRQWVERCRRAKELAELVKAFSRTLAYKQRNRLQWLYGVAGVRSLLQPIGAATTTTTPTSSATTMARAGDASTSSSSFSSPSSSAVRSVWYLDDRSQMKHCLRKWIACVNDGCEIREQQKVLHDRALSFRTKVLLRRWRRTVCGSRNQALALTWASGVRERSLLRAALDAWKAEHQLLHGMRRRLRTAMEGWQTVAVRSERLRRKEAEVLLGVYQRRLIQHCMYTWFFGFKRLLHKHEGILDRATVFHLRKERVLAVRTWRAWIITRRSTQLRLQNRLLLAQPIHRGAVLRLRIRQWHQAYVVQHTEKQVQFYRTNILRRLYLKTLRKHAKGRLFWQEKARIAIAHDEHRLSLRVCRRFAKSVFQRRVSVRAEVKELARPMVAYWAKWIRWRRKSRTAAAATHAMSRRFSKQKFFLTWLQRLHLERMVAAIAYKRKKKKTEASLKECFLNWLEHMRIEKQYVEIVALVTRKKDSAGCRTAFHAWRRIKDEAKQERVDEDKALAFLLRGMLRHWQVLAQASVRKAMVDLKRSARADALRTRQLRRRAWDIWNKQWALKMLLQLCEKRADRFAQNKAAQRHLRTWMNRLRYWRFVQKRWRRLAWLKQKKEDTERRVLVTTCNHLVLGTNAALTKLRIVAHSTYMGLSPGHAFSVWKAHVQMKKADHAAQTIAPLLKARIAMRQWRGYVAQQVEKQLGIVHMAMHASSSSSFSSSSSSSAASRALVPPAMSPFDKKKAVLARVRELATVPQLRATPIKRWSIHTARVYSRSGPPLGDLADAESSEAPDEGVDADLTAYSINTSRRSISHVSPEQSFEKRYVAGDAVRTRACVRADNADGDGDDDAYEGDAFSTSPDRSRIVRQSVRRRVLCTTFESWLRLARVVGRAKRDSGLAEEVWRTNLTRRTFTAWIEALLDTAGAGRVSTKAAPVAEEETGGWISNNGTVLSSSAMTQPLDGSRVNSTSNSTNQTSVVDMSSDVNSPDASSILQSMSILTRTSLAAVAASTSSSAPLERDTYDGSFFVSPDATLNNFSFMR